MFCLHSMVLLITVTSVSQGEKKWGYLIPQLFHHCSAITSALRLTGANSMSPTYPGIKDFNFRAS